MAPQECVREAGRQHPDRRHRPRARAAVTRLSFSCRSGFSLTPLVTIFGSNVGSCTCSSSSGTEPPLTDGARTMAMNRWVLLLASATLAACAQKDAPSQATNEPAQAAPAPATEPAGEPSRTAALAP